MELPWWCVVLQSAQIIGVLCLEEMLVGLSWQLYVRLGAAVLWCACVFRERLGQGARPRFTCTLHVDDTLLYVWSGRERLISCIRIMTAVRVSVPRIWRRTEAALPWREPGWDSVKEKGSVRFTVPPCRQQRTRQQSTQHQDTDQQRTTNKRSRDYF